MTHDVRRYALALAGLIAIAAYAFVFRPLESTVADRYARLDDLRITLERNRTIARRLPQLAHERAANAAALRRYHVRDSRAVIVDRFLSATARIAADNGIAIRTVTAQTPAAPLAPPAAVPVPLDQLRLDLTMRGPYANVIRAVRALNDANIALEIAVAALSTTDRRPDASPMLNATFHVTLIREADAVPTHVPHPI